MPYILEIPHTHHLVVLLLTDGLYKSKYVKMWDRETLKLTDDIYSILRTLYRWTNYFHRIYLQYFWQDLSALHLTGFVCNLLLKGFVCRGKFGEFFHRAVVTGFSEFSDTDLEVSPKHCNSLTTRTAIIYLSFRSKMCSLWKVLYCWSPVMRIPFSFMSAFETNPLLIHYSHCSSINIFSKSQIEFPTPLQIYRSYGRVRQKQGSWAATSSQTKTFFSVASPLPMRSWFLLVFWNISVFLTKSWWKHCSDKMGF